MYIVQLTIMLPETTRLTLIFFNRGLNDALDSYQEMFMDTTSGFFKIRVYKSIQLRFT